MKKTLFTTALIAIASVAFVSCQREISESEKETIDGTALHFIVKANQASETKTSVIANGDGTYTSTWKKNDELGAFLSGTTISGSTAAVDMTLSNTADDGAAGVFEGTAVASGAGTFLAFYPAASFATGYAGGTVGLNVGTPDNYVQHPTVGSPDPACDILLSQACDYESDGSVVAIDNLYFMRPLSILKINLKGSYAAGEEISWLKFETATGTLSGRVKVDLSTPELGAWTVQKNYALAEYSSSKPVINHATDNTVYLVVNPITIASGTTITVTGETAHVTIEKTFNLKADMTFPAGNIAVLNLTINAADCTIKSAENYSLVTSSGAFESGAKYIFALKDGSDGHYVFINNAGGGSNTTPNMESGALTVTDGVISSPNSKYVFTAETGTASGTFKLKNSNKNYINNTSSTTLNTNNGTAQDWYPTFIEASKTYKLQVTNTSGRYIAYGTNTYAVKAYDPANNAFVDQVAGKTALGQCSGAISVFKFTDSRTPLATPTGLSVADMTVSWTGVANAGSYNVTIGGVKYVTTSTSYTFTGRAGYYDVEVVAVPSIAAADTYKNSSAVSSKDATFGTPTILTPELAEGTVTSSSIQATWTDDDFATNGYHCELYLGVAKQTEKDVAAGTQAVSFTGLTNSTEYTIKVNGKAVTGDKAYAASSVASINITTAATSDKTYTITWNSTNNSGNANNYTTSWHVTASGLRVDMVNWNNSNSSWNYVKAGPKGNTAATATMTTYAVIPEAIKTIGVTIDAITNGSITSIVLDVATNSSFTENHQSVSKTTLTTGVTQFDIETPTENCYYKLTFTLNNNTPNDKTGKNGVAQVSKLVFTTLTTLPS